jgi:hypothetical protein
MYHNIMYIDLCLCLCLCICGVLYGSPGSFWLWGEVKPLFGFEKKTGGKPLFGFEKKETGEKRGGTSEDKEGEV